MENENVTPSSSHVVAEQLTKVVLCAIAGFVAGKLTEKTFDAALVKFRNR